MVPRYDRHARVGLRHLVLVGCAWLLALLHRAPRQNGMIHCPFLNVSYQLLAHMGVQWGALFALPLSLPGSGAVNTTIKRRPCRAASRVRPPPAARAPPAPCPSRCPPLLGRWRATSPALPLPPPPPEACARGQGARGRKESGWGRAESARGQGGSPLRGGRSGPWCSSLGAISPLCVCVDLARSPGM